MRIAKEKGVNIPVVVGGIIPPEDVPKLKELGVVEVCGPGTSLKKIVELFRRLSRDG